MTFFYVQTAMENGVKFWRAFLDCSVLLDEQVSTMDIYIYTISFYVRFKLQMEKQLNEISLN